MFKLLLIIIACLIAFFCMLLFSETKADIKYKDKKLFLVIKNGFIKIKISPKSSKVNKIEEEKSNEKESEAERKIGSVKKNYKEYKELINVFLNTMRFRIKIDSLSLSLAYGTGDAASTGILYGVVWSLISGAYNLLSGFFDFEFPKVEITPDFQQSKFDLAFSGILRVRLVHIINAFIKMYFRNKKIKRERGR